MSPSMVMPRDFYPLCRARDAVAAGRDLFEVWLEYRPLDGQADLTLDEFREALAGVRRPAPPPAPPNVRAW